MPTIFTIVLYMISLSANARSDECPLTLPTENICVQLDWKQGPQVDTKSRAELRFWVKGDSTQTLVEPAAQLQVKTWMEMANGHHHGGPKVTLVKVANGIYQIEDIRFFSGMEGQWFLLIQTYQGETLVDQIKYAVEF